MNFEPQKLFIGLMDFFSILLPGALLTYLLMGEVRTTDVDYIPSGVLQRIANTGTTDPAFLASAHHVSR